MLVVIWKFRVLPDMDNLVKLFIFFSIVELKLFGFLNDKIDVVYEKRCLNMYLLSASHIPLVD